MIDRSRWLAVLNLLILGVVLVAPLGALLLAAFSDYLNSKATATPAFTIQQQSLLLLRSIGLALSAGGLGTVLGLLAAYATLALPRRAQSWLVMALLLPLVIPPFIHALSWIMLANSVGWAIHGFGPAALVLALSFWPVAALLAWVGLHQSEGTLLEAARFGPSRFTAWWRIELGLIYPHVSTAFLLIALFSFSDYGVPSLFRVHTYPVFVFSQFAAFYDLRSAVMASWPYWVLPVLAIWLWQRKGNLRCFEVVGKATHSSQRVIDPLARGGWAALYGTILSLSLALPLAILMKTAGPVSNYVLAWRTAQGQIGASLLLASLSALVMVLLGFFLALGRGKSQGRIQLWLDYASLLPIALPGTLLGMALIYLWNRPQTHFIYGSILVVVLLYLARFLPFATRSQIVGLTQIDQNLVDAARLADRPVRCSLWSIVLPLLAPAMIVGGALGFICSLHELAGTLLVIPPGMETLSVRIYSLYHYGASQWVAALSLFLVALSGLILGVAFLINRWINPYSLSRAS